MYSTLSKAQIYERFGAVQMATLKLLKGCYLTHVPKFIVQPVQLLEIGIESLDISPSLTLASPSSPPNPPKELGTARSSLAPEFYFSFPPSKPTDIWALACVLVETITNMGHFPLFFDTWAVHIRTIVGVLGPLPIE